jgi:small-conductance mechanosensitive channel
MNTNVGDTIILSLNQGLTAAGRFIPNLIAGIIIILIGIILASIVKRLILELFRAVKLEEFLHKYGLPDRREFNWGDIIAEVVRWFIIISFLLPAADIWGLRQISLLLNELLLYIPNVIIAAVIVLVGLVFSRLAYDIVYASTQDLLQDSARLIASVVRWAIIVFAVLAALTQLGVAEDLIRILFTGFVAMLALAGGLAFGLGGQDTARTLLESFRNSLTRSTSSRATKK